MALDFEEMRRIYRLEKSTARLVEIPDDFFTQLHGLIEEERKKYFDSLQDLNATRARDFGNLKKLIDEWFLVREKKLLNTVLVSAQMGEKDMSHMAAEEKRMFTLVYDALTAHREISKKVLDANGGFSPIITPVVEPAPVVVRKTEPAPAEPEAPAPAYSPTPPSSDSPTNIRILSEIPSFVGTDLREYGPYKIGQVVELPPKIAQLFISRKLGEAAQ